MSSSFLFKLSPVQAVIEPPRPHQFIVRPLFHNISLIDHQDIVRVRIVESRWAITKQVRPFISSRMAR